MTWILVPIIILIFASIKQINQYERGVVLTFGKYTSSLQPGLRLVVPFIQRVMRVDIRMKAEDVPDQKAITRDNVSVNVNAVIYYRVSDANKALLDVENFRYAMSQYAQTTMRNMVGEVTLDELLSSRDQIADKIRAAVEKETTDWGLLVHNVELKDISLPPDMERTIAKQAEAEREKRAVIINSEGELAAAENLATAARILSDTPGALHLRTLQSVNDMSSDQSNTVVFMLPLEVLRALDGFAKKG